VKVHPEQHRDTRHEAVAAEADRQYSRMVDAAIERRAQSRKEMHR